jgi:hypothetical protein
LQVLLPPRWNQLSPAARAGSSLPPPLTQASEQQKSIFRLGVLFGEIHISPSVLVLISSAVFQNDGDVCFGSLASALFLIAEVHHVVSRDRR